MATSRDVPCVVCRAHAGKPCRDDDGYPKPIAHVERTRSWSRAKEKAAARRGPSKEQRTRKDERMRIAKWLREEASRVFSFQGAVATDALLRAAHSIEVTP